MSGRYYLPFMDGWKEISPAEAQHLHEQGYFKEVEHYEYD